MISLYLEKQSWFHRITAGRKLLFLCLCSILLLPVESLLVLLALLGFVIMLYASGGHGMFVQIRLIKPLIPFFVIILLFHAWAGSIEQGVVALMRLLIMILLANLITMTTRMTDMMAAITPVFQWLKPIGFAPRRLSIAVALMIRFAPVLFAVLESLSEAWRSRSSKRPRWRLLAPLTLQALKMADTVGDALQARGGAAGMASFKRTNS